MITSISYLLFAHNVGHYYLIFSRANIFFLIPTLNTMAFFPSRAFQQEAMLVTLFSTQSANSGYT